MSGVKIMLSAQPIKEILQALFDGDEDLLHRMHVMAQTDGNPINDLIREYNAADDLYLTPVETLTQ